MRTEADRRTKRCQIDGDAGKVAVVFGVVA